LPFGVELARTQALCALALSLLARAGASARGWIMGASLAAGAAILAAMLYLPPLRALLETRALTPDQWLAPAAAAAACLLLGRRFP
jgi:hypothetical protein